LEGAIGAAIALRGFYPVVQTANVMGSVGVGIDYSTCSYGGGSYAAAPCFKYTGTASLASPLAIEIPFKIEYKVADILSIHTQVGIKAGMSDADLGNWGIKADVLGSAGVTLWLGSSSAAPAKKKAKKVKVVEEEEDATPAPTPAPAPAPKAAAEEDEEE